MVEIHISEIIFISSFFFLITLGFMKSILHLNYLKIYFRNSEANLLRNTIFQIPLLAYFQTFFLFPVLKKEQDEYFERKRRQINNVVIGIYICILLIAIVGISSALLQQ